jgi:hypothetical protein
MKRLAGKTEIENALQRLDGLTQEETRIVVARHFGFTYGLDNKVDVLQKGTRGVFNGSKWGIDDACYETEASNMARRFSSIATIAIRGSSTHSQVFSRARFFEAGLPLPISRLIMIRHEHLDPMEPERGSSRATPSKNGRRRVPYCGFAGSVRYSHPLHFCGC